MSVSASVKPNLIVRIAAWCVVVFLMAPIPIIILVSFSSAQYLTFPPPGFSLQWYERFLGSNEWAQSIWVSLQVAVFSAILTMVLATMAAIPMVRANFSRKSIVYAVLLAPMIIPVIITAIALYFVFAQMGLNGTVLAITIGHTIVVLPIAFVVLSSTLQGLDPRLEKAAISLGASPLAAFYHITLPLLMPGILSAGLFSFLTSFDELIIPLFLGGPATQTLAVRIWNSVVMEIEPTISAVSVFLIAMTIVVMVLASLLKRAFRWSGSGRSQQETPHA
ncbi:ABC transporter permease [Aquamicrobium lusatiense]|jgi:putative spermidine/putrescine transport system permease protein|uniref:ABC transporter permease n=1 Tax=Aquamicrobium lusatiense TaxID=89772 RepID=UPI002453EC46|nr:ABC transporter permease [Aquamicrobium lusatiense]MDH4989769.1 ABC transporter permease [Aquamicrobium lusatiense]